MQFVAYEYSEANMNKAILVLLISCFETEAKESQIFIAMNQIGNKKLL